ncbi:hypothetical protein [Parerythrobacter aestuarii]|uniref:hypothetical protein n=1 Tax=Parerythrobacter aestuarii TaxID=3020909 RepID=UPI0024DE32D2|nr:hypothetical protein [Parerythrobacter aestuarii]
MHSRLSPIARYATLASALALACCAPPPPPPIVSTPAPVPAPTPTPAPPPPVVEQPEYANWLDAPQTPGDWSYRDGPATSIAVFVETGGMESFAIVCTKGGEVTLSRAGRASQPVPLQIITETGRQFFNAEPDASGGSFLNVQLRSRNPILDAMALSRGRFGIETAGLKTLYLPAWAEVTRVIEDCR